MEPRSYLSTSTMSYLTTLLKSGTYTKNGASAKPNANFFLANGITKYNQPKTTTEVTYLSPTTNAIPSHQSGGSTKGTKYTSQALEPQ